MIEIRWLVRGGEKCLQYREWVPCSAAVNDWQDVPVVEVTDGKSV